MAIGRISGSVLKSNLTRNGTDLAFETNLLYLDVTNSRVGIGTSEPSTALQVAGTVTATAFAGDGSNLTIASTDLSNTSNITLNDATQTLTNKTLTSPTINGATFGSADVTFDTNVLHIDSSNNRVGIGTTSPSAQLHITGTDTSDQVIFENTDAGSGSAPDLVLYRNSSSPAVNDLIGRIDFRGKNDGGSSIDYAFIYGVIEDETADTEDGALWFNIEKNGSAIQPFKLGNQIVFNDNASDIDLRIEGTGDANLFYADAGNDRIGIGTSTPARDLQIKKSTDGSPVRLEVNNTSNTGGSHGVVSIYSGGTSGGDPYLHFKVDSGEQYSIGIDNDQSDSFVLSNNYGVGSNNLLSVATTGAITFNNAFTFPTSDGTANQVLATDGSGTLSFTTISTNSVSQGNSNVTVTDSGTGAITIAADGSTIITMNATTALDASGVTNAIRLPGGTTAQRPSGAVGEIRYNSSTDTIEGYTTAGGWAQLGATSSTSENTDDTATGNATAISTTEKVVNQFTVGSFDSAWYLTINRDEINDQVSTAKHSMAHNNSAAVVSSSHITKSDATNSFVTIDADVTGGNARLKATGTSVVNSLSFYRIALGDNTTAGTTGNVTTVINTDVDSASESIDSWAKASYRAAKYYISVNNASKTEVSNLEALVVHDGTTAYITAYGATNTGSNDLINLTAAVDGSNVVVSATGNEPNLRVTAYRILLADDESASSGDNVNVVAATNVSSTATTVDSFVNSAYTGAFYVFTGYNSTEGAASAAEVMVVSNDEAYIAVGPTISTKGTDQLTFSATQSGSTVTVKAASTSGASTTVNGYRVHMLRGSAGASTADTVLVSTTQTISGAKTFSSPIALTVGSDPSTATNNAHIYAKDDSSSAEVFVRDEAGNVTKISPHNEQGEWEYFSRNVKTGKTVRVNMEEMIRDIEKLTGKKYIKDF